MREKVSDTRLPSGFQLRISPNPSGWSFPGGSCFGLHVHAQHSIHSGLVSCPLFTVPFYNILIEAQ